MGTSQSQFSNIGSTLVDLGNNFATTEKPIMEMAHRMAGAGKQVGLTEAQVLGFAAALSSVGIVLFFTCVPPVLFLYVFIIVSASAFVMKIGRAFQKRVALSAKRSKFRQIAKQNHHLPTKPI